MARNSWISSNRDADDDLCRTTYSHCLHSHEYTTNVFYRLGINLAGIVYSTTAGEVQKVIRDNNMIKVWLTLCWLFGFHHKLYYEKQPKIDDVDAMMQRLAMTFSRGKLTWGKTALSECRCKVCNRKFWTVTRNSVLCKRYSCYMKFHLHPEQFTLRRVK